MSNKQEVRIHIAVAGLGRMAKRHVATLLNRVPQAQVVAVCSESPAELAWAGSEYASWGIDVYDSYAAMVDYPGLQAVWVSTSMDVHASQTMTGIEKGLHMLFEKPLSTEAARVVEAATSHAELKVMAGFSRRFDASYRAAKTQLESGTIGEPIVVRSQTCDLLDHTGFFVWYAARNGGLMLFG